MLTLSLALALAIAQENAGPGDPCTFIRDGDNPPQISKSKEVAGRLAILEAVRRSELPGSLNEDVSFKDKAHKTVVDARAQKSLVAIAPGTPGTCVGVGYAQIDPAYGDLAIIFHVRVKTGPFKGQTVWSPDVGKWKKQEPQPPPSNWEKVTSFIGEGIKRTEPFQVRAPWKLIWIIHAKNNDSDSNLLQVEVETPGTDLSELAVNVGNVGFTMDETTFYKGGVFNLKINSIGRYAIHVFEWKKPPRKTALKQRAGKKK